jgi:hypothetical protein
MSGMGREWDLKRIKELKQMLIHVLQRSDFPEDKKDNFRWILQQPLYKFKKCNVDKVMGIIAELQMLSNDCGSFDIM